MQKPVGQQLPYNLGNILITELRSNNNCMTTGQPLHHENWRVFRDTITLHVESFFFLISFIFLSQMSMTEIDLKYLTNLII